MKYLFPVFIFTVLIFSGCSSKPSVIIDEGNAGSEISVKKGDIFEVRLEVQFGTGFSWSLTELPSSIEPVGEPEQIKKGEKKPGAYEYQVFRYRALSEGEIELHYVYEQPWEKGDPPAERVNFTIKITGNTN